jgi:hypothetical protein
MHLLSAGSLRHLLLTMPSAVGEKCVHVILLSLLVTHVFGQGKPPIFHFEVYTFFTHITRYVQIMKNAVQICTLPDAAIGRSLLFCAVAVG